MSRRLRQIPLHQLEKQTQVKVVQQIQATSLDQAWFATLAAFFAGVFYFFSYYFWGTAWRVLLEH